MLEFKAKSKGQKVNRKKADIAWLIYDLELCGTGTEKRYRLKKIDEVFTEFEPALLSITTPVPGRIDDFMNMLQVKIDGELETPPTNMTIDKPF